MLLALAILPGILISLYIIKKDIHEPEPLKYLIWCFIFGMLSTIPAVLLEKIGEDDFGITASNNPLTTALFAYGVVGFSEEISKFLFLFFFIYPKKEFNEPLDGIIYSVMIGMGFATLENILYAYIYGPATTLLRMFTAVPAHACFAIIMGYFVGLSKFNPARKFNLILLGIAGAVFHHGTYDFFLFQQNYEALGLLAFASLIIGVRYSHTLIRLHQNRSPFNPINIDSREDIIDLL